MQIEIIPYRFIFCLLFVMSLGICLSFLVHVDRSVFCVGFINFSPYAFTWDIVPLCWLYTRTQASQKLILLMKITTYTELITLLGYSAPRWATLLAGSFVIFTLVLSFYLLFEHLSAYKNPEVLFFWWQTFSSF